MDVRTTRFHQHAPYSMYESAWFTSELQQQEIILGSCLLVSQAKLR